MFIKPIKKWHQLRNGGDMTPYRYYRLCESYRDGIYGRPRQRVVMGIGDLQGMDSEDDIRELSRLLTALVGKGEHLITDRPEIGEKALELYGRYRRDKMDVARRSGESSGLSARCDSMEKERVQDTVTVKWRTLRTSNARSVGAEHVCRAAAEELGMESVMRRAGLDAAQPRLATLQTVARGFILPPS